jgi:hypothetical protein
MDLYRSSFEGHKNRFKLRIRSYSDCETDPVFFEVKHRTGVVVRKTRAAAGRDLASMFMAGRPLGSHSLASGAATSIGEFTHLATRCGVRPFIRIRYWREAYESTGLDPVRITFDSDIAYRLSRDGRLDLNADHWDYMAPGGIVLEIKFTELYPSWVRRLIQRFELQKRSVSKYALSVDRMLHNDDDMPPLVVARRQERLSHRLNGAW